MLVLKINRETASPTFSDGLTQCTGLNIDNLAARFFPTLPPSEQHWENAIMTVEDALAPFSEAARSEQVLRIEAGSLQNLAANRKIFRASVEQISQQLSRYGRAAELAENAEIYAEFLIVREFLHHMDFSGAEWADSK
ncbi:hypothetical protein BG910_00905 [Neisseria chenwenguii]|uniref:Uncharacterized protein n=1 Tax=Neisseria chenwenguii TaxID=1853278 RepID=A0A220RZ65_9NEIS|nr:hypothetical protein [Neisseria chenwenguii]ASK26494.1 hypothetical protein BG910_00905 [Neisseria chenwenguii]